MAAALLLTSAVMDPAKTPVHDPRTSLVRGALAGAFGLSLLGWPEVTLTNVVALFGVYTFVDGLWTIIGATFVRARRGDVWPNALHGLVSTIAGLVALAWPPGSLREAVTVIAVWAAVAGLLLIIVAARMRLDTAGYWLLTTAGVTAQLLALVLVALPYAELETVARSLASYALIFGLATVFSTVPARRAARGSRTGASA